MHFTHFAIGGGRIIHRQSIDTAELEPALLAAVTEEMRPLLREAEAYIVIVATGERDAIRAALERQRQPVPRLPVGGTPFMMTLGMPGLAIDNFDYAESIKHGFWLWVEKQFILSGMVLSAEEEAHQREAGLYGKLAGSRAAESIDLGRDPYEDDIEEFHATTAAILKERPCVVSSFPGSLPDQTLHEEAIRFARHLAAAMLVNN